MPRSPRYAPQHRVLPRFGVIGAALAAVLLLSGCFAIGVTAKVHADDTVSGSARFGVSKSLAALTGAGSSGLFGQAGQACQFGNRSLASKPFDDGAYTGVECDFDGLTLADFNAGMQGPRLRHSGDRFQLSGSFDLAAALRQQAGQPSGSATGSAAPPTALPSGLASLLPSDLASLLPSDLASLLPSGLPRLDPSAILRESKISFEFSFPGRILSSKGQVHGNTVTFAPGSNGRIEFETLAEADPDGAVGIGPAGWAGLAALLAAVAVLAGWLLRRRGRPAEVAGHPGPTQPAWSAAATPQSNPLPGFGPYYGPGDDEPDLSATGHHPVNPDPADHHPGYHPEPEDPPWRPPDARGE